VEIKMLRVIREWLVIDAPAGNGYSWGGFLAEVEAFPFTVQEFEVAVGLPAINVEFWGNIGNTMFLRIECFGVVSLWHCWAPHKGPFGPLSGNLSSCLRLFGCS
jgi:hypothetical protein